LNLGPLVVKLEGVVALHGVNEIAEVGAEGRGQELSFFVESFVAAAEQEVLHELQHEVILGFA